MMKLVDTPTGPKMIDVNKAFIIAAANSGSIQDINLLIDNRDLDLDTDIPKILKLILGRGGL